MKLVFGFDIGTSGFAAAIRKDDDIIWTRSYVLPEDFASTKIAAEKRRLARTRNAHRAREWWWNQKASEIGIEPLKEIEKKSNGEFRVTRVDEKLKREFPKKDENIIYTSCLLRCHILLNGAKDLKPWQIYKAVHSAIQKRGYDPDIPWKKTKSKKSKKKTPNEDGKETTSTDKDEKESLESLNDFEKKLDDIGFLQDQKFSCFFEAYQMGLYTPTESLKGLRQNHEAKNGGTQAGMGYTASRKMVEAELKALLEKINVYYPMLDIEECLYGIKKIAYASHPKNKKQIIDKEPNEDKKKALNKELKTGTETDWQSLLGQKIPKFDNRILNKCLLIPRFHVCKKNDELVKKFHFSYALKNIRVKKDSDKTGRRLSHDEFKKLYSKFEKKLSATKLELELKLKELNLKFESNSYPIEKSEESGRASFSRPALRLLNEMIHKGFSPKEMIEKTLKKPCANNKNILISENNDPIKGLTVKDLDWLISIEDKSWEDFHLPQSRYDAVFNSALDKKERQKQLMKNCNNPVVRHRIELFLITLQKMKSHIFNEYQIKEPNYIAIEFVRDDFLGKKAKKKLLAFQEKKKKENEDNKEKAKDLFNEVSKINLQKVKLWTRQNYTDPYTGSNIPETGIQFCEIDHIVPISNGGSDSDFNLVLTSHTNNNTKGNRTPFEWLNADPEKWNNFLIHIEQMKLLSAKTKKLLTSPDASTLIEKYQSLAETAWISRLAGTTTLIEMDWLPPHLGGEKKVHVISGALTYRVRHDNVLNNLLNFDEENKTEKSGSDTEKDKKNIKNRKNRKDIRHHILDAMTITFCQDWQRQYVKIDDDDRKYFELPSGTREKFKEILESSFPKKTPQKSALEDNFYGLTKEGTIFKRHKIIDLALKLKESTKEFDKSYLKNNIDTLEKEPRNKEIYTVLKKLQKKVTEEDNPKLVWENDVNHLKLKNGTQAYCVKIFNKMSEKNKILNPNEHQLHGQQVICSKGSHQGFIFYQALEKKLKKDSIKVTKCQPVPSFTNKQEAINELKSQGAEILFFIRSGDYLELVKDHVEKGIIIIPKGIYQLKTIKNSVEIKLKNILTQKEMPSKQIHNLIKNGDEMKPHII